MKCYPTIYILKYICMNEQNDRYNLEFKCNLSRNIFITQYLFEYRFILLIFSLSFITFFLFFSSFFLYFLNSNFNRIKIIFTIEYNNKISSSILLKRFDRINFHVSFNTRILIASRAFRRARLVHAI